MTRRKRPAHSSRAERAAIVEPAAEQPRPTPRPKRLIQILILVMLAAPTLISTADRIRTGYGFDFYNFWGVTVARRSQGPALGDPYRNGADYLAKVKQVGTANDTAKLGVAADYWHSPDYTATPLLYMVFGLVPRDFDVALAVYQTVQVAAFVVAWLVLGYLCGIDLFSASCLALASLIAYQPFVSDLRVANLGSVQFVLLVGMLAWARALRDRCLRDSAGGRRRVVACAALFAALAAVTLFKPNVALVAVLLAAHLAIRHGRKRVLPAAAAALCVAALLVILPALYFGTWDVWKDWYTFVYGSNADMLVRSISDGNYSTVAMLSAILDTSASGTAITIMALLVGSLVVAAATVRDAAGDRVGWRAAAARLGDEPELAACVGVALTLAASPLLWLHYYIIALIPCLWLLLARPASPWVARLAALCIVLSSGVPGLLLTWAGWGLAIPVTTAMSWLPLWVATLMAVRAPRERSAWPTPAPPAILP